MNENPSINEEILALGESLTVQEVGSMMGGLRAALNAGGPIVIDAAELSQIDGAGVQLLCLLFKEAGERNIPCAWREHSLPLQQAVKQLGLSDELHLSNV
jgi:anti-anti-sigma regulatory factor